MKLSFLLLLILMESTNLRAQDSTLVTIKAGNSIRDVFTAKDVFLYPQFISGHVFMRDGSKATAMMNYNILYDQVLFIDAKGDTLAISDEKNCKYLTLKQDTFYYDNGYIKQVAGNSVAKLAEKKYWEVADIRKIGSHGRPSTTFAVTSYSTITDRFGRTYDLVLNEDLLLRKNTSYYLGDKYNHFVSASKKNLLLLFPKEQSTVTDYLKEQMIDFTKRADLEKLLAFLAQIY
jgi:hypothetical protein